MKANLPQREPKMLAQWSDSGLYEKIRTRSAGRPQFILHDGPPYANGDIHLGHALNKTLKDIIIKSKTLSGFDAPYVPGWDCHGLPIEINVEKKTGKAGAKITAKEFRQACREYAPKQIKGQREDFKRLGILGEWDNPYLTMNFPFEANIIRTLGKMIENDHVYRGLKPVNWCCDCGSALAEAEVEYADKTSPSVDVAFSFVDASFVATTMKASVDSSVSIDVVIWTTTPWTLPANLAVSLHSEVEYALVSCEVDGQHKQLVLAQELVDNAMERYAASNVNVLGTCQGCDLEKQLLSHPWLSRKVPVILGEHVTIESGTGA
ncbi:MAG: class I tRNA ligase family protein, partial [Pseudomonadota bacterium]